jgi:hypothetical protein
MRRRSQLDERAMSEDESNGDTDLSDIFSDDSSDGSADTEADGDSSDDQDSDSDSDSLFNNDKE